MNDSLRTTLCLQYRPHLIAAAALHLSARCIKSPIPEVLTDPKRPWWEVLDIKVRLQDLEGTRALEFDSCLLLSTSYPHGPQ